MARHKLTKLEVQNAKPGKLGDGAGLWLHTRLGGSAQWFLRVSIHGRRREMGLGGFPDVTLAEARELAAKWRRVAKENKDPIKVREKEKREANRQQHTLAQLTLLAFEARKAELKGDGKAGRWMSPLDLHVLPKIGSVPIEDLDQQDIRNTLAPIWHTKADTAKKAIQRLGIVVKYGAAMGLDVDMQVTEKAKALLGKSRHQAKKVPALHWNEVPAFYASLATGTPTELALRLLILTGSRSGPVRFAKIDQFDLEDCIWTVPAENMKSRVGKSEDFRIPLSPEAVKVVQQVLPHARDGWLFPNVRRGVISDATMSRYMERRCMEARPHGFRSSLRTWVAETTDAPHEVAESLLAHSTGSKVVDAYRRTDFLDQRRVLLDDWAQHVGGSS